MQEQIVLDRHDSEPPAPVRCDINEMFAAAVFHHQTGLFAEAERLYRAILQSDPRQAVASYNLGLLCSTQGRLQEAIGAYRYAIAVKPDYSDAITNLGTIYLDVGQPEAAVAFYQQAIAVSPGNAMALGNLGKALQDLGRIDEALAAYLEALRHQPDNPTVNTNLGGALLERKAWDKSVTVSRHALALDPGNVMAHANLGTALLNLGRHDEAVAACRAAVALEPQNGAVLATLGGAMLELGALQEAEDLCRRAIARDQNLPNAFLNLSHVLKGTNRVEEAILTARRAIAIRPDSADYHFHLAHLLLLRGSLDDGWAEYEWRWKLPDFAWRDAIQGISSQPQWTGEDIRDKTILIYTEQGLGDVIQFARYLPLLVRRAGRVIVAVHPPLRQLLQAIDGIVVVLLDDTPLPPFQVHCPLLSLPKAFDTRLETIPASVPYISADPTKRLQWRRRLGAGSLRVGIVWAGNPMTKRDRFRSPGFTNILPLFSVPGIDFVILQVGAGRNDLDPSRLPLRALDLGQEVTDLSDTAAIMSELDLMISSCTGPLHLAGALGVPTWAMIPFAPYFPWLLKRSSSP